MAVKTIILGQNITEPLHKDGVKAVSMFSRRQQRKLRLFFLKASRPILKRVKDQSEKPKQSLGAIESIAAPTDYDQSTDLPLRALQAYEEQRRREEMKSSGAPPFESATGAVDWMLDFAQGVPYEWPMFKWLTEKEQQNELFSKSGVLVVPPRMPQTVEIPLDFLDEPSTTEKANIEEFYARCAWPRPQKVVISEKTANAMFARCEWPRNQLSAPTLTSNPAPSEESTSFARCAWPPVRRQTKVEAASKTMAFTEEQVLPRCAWPRKQSQPGTPNHKNNSSIISQPAYPRCPWPRAQSSSSLLITSNESDSPQEATEESAPCYPRCSWPRKKPNN